MNNEREERTLRAMDVESHKLLTEQEHEILTYGSVVPSFGHASSRFLLRERILGSMHFWSANTSSRRSRQPVHEKEMVRYLWRDGSIRKMTLVAYASGDLGFPTAVDFELFLGLESLLLDRIKESRTLDPVIRFQGHEVLERAGKEKGGREYQELNRCLMRLAGLMIGVGSGKTRKSGEIPMKSPRSSFMRILRNITLPGTTTDKGLLLDGYEIHLDDWYCESLLAGNCFVVDHHLLQHMKGHITKVLHQLLSHLFYLGSGTAMQSYSELAEGFELTRYTAISQVRQQLGPAHEELMARKFLSSWDLVPVKGSKPREYMLMWEAGPAWREAEQQLEERRAHYGVGDDRPAMRTLEDTSDPMVLIADSQIENRSTEETAASAAKLLDLILEFSGRRKDPHIWVKTWQRAINSVPHMMIWRRYHEVKERVARGEKINPGSYLYDLVKRDAAKLNVSWAVSAVDRGGSEPKSEG